MSGLVPELKSLITRLARKEVKRALARGTSLRRDNQSLRARIKSLEAGLARTVRSISKSGVDVTMPKPGEENELKRLRFTAKGIKTMRKKTRLSQAMFAKLVGASTISVSNWELGKSLPRKSSDAFRKLVEFREAKMGAREAKNLLEGNGTKEAKNPA